MTFFAQTQNRGYWFTPVKVFHNTRLQTIVFIESFLITRFPNVFTRFDEKWRAKNLDLLIFVIIVLFTMHELSMCTMCIILVWCR